MKTHKIVISTFLVLMFIIACSSYDELAANKKQNQIMSLVSIGMNIHEARKILINEGFKVGDVHFPTKRKNYCQILVPLIQKIPNTETLRYVTNSKPGKTKAYVIIIAKPDGTVTEID